MNRNLMNKKELICVKCHESNSFYHSIMFKDTTHELGIITEDGFQTVSSKYNLTSVQLLQVVGFMADILDGTR